MGQDVASCALVQHSLDSISSTRDRQGARIGYIVSAQVAATVRLQSMGLSERAVDGIDVVNWFRTGLVQSTKVYLDNHPARLDD